MLQWPAPRPYATFTPNFVCMHGRPLCFAHATPPKHVVEHDDATVRRLILRLMETSAVKQRGDG